MNDYPVRIFLPPQFIGDAGSFRVLENFNCFDSIMNELPTIHNNKSVFQLDTSLN